MVFDVDGGGGESSCAFLVHTLGGPSFAGEYLSRLYVANHAVAPLNILAELTELTTLVFHPEISALNDVASLNMDPMSVTDLTSHALTS